MKISELIKKLEEIKANEGDIRVTTFDSYKANEGWDYDNIELWQDVEPQVDFTLDDDDNEVEKVVVM